MESREARNFTSQLGPRAPPTSTAAKKSVVRSRSVHRHRCRRRRPHGVSCGGGGGGGGNVAVRCKVVGGAGGEEEEEESSAHSPLRAHPPGPVVRRPPAARARPAGCGRSCRLRLGQTSLSPRPPVAGERAAVAASVVVSGLNNSYRGCNLGRRPRRGSLPASVRPSPSALLPSLRRRRLPRGRY